MPSTFSNCKFFKSSITYFYNTLSYSLLHKTPITRVNSEKFQNFHFWRKPIKITTRVNSRIFANSPNIWIALIFWKWSFRWWLVIIFVIFSQKWQFRLKNENFEISRNAPLLSLIDQSCLELNFGSCRISPSLLAELCFWKSSWIWQKSSEQLKSQFLEISPVFSRF